MPLVETLVLSLGASLSKAAIKLWMSDSGLAIDASSALVDTFKKHLPDELSRRRANRLYEQIAEQTAEKIEPLFRQEFGRLEDDRKERVALAVAKTIDDAGASAEILAQLDFDPVKLETYFNKFNSTAEFSLTATQSVFYERILRESCFYIIEIANNLPTLKTAIASEILKRQTEILEKIEKILKNIPESIFDSSKDSDVEGFENLYRRTISSKLDEIELHGLSLRSVNPRYSLSVAYISLMMSLGGKLAQNEETINRVPVGKAFAGGKRFLIFGEPGSGKTTLLKWIAVQTAKLNFENELAEWNNCFPFFVRLRRYSVGEFPVGAKLVTHLAPTLEGHLPHQWVEKKLNSGQAILLVDGLDELPENKRNSARKWLKELAEVYANATIIVTSRPPAVPRTWLDSVNFDVREIQPMNSHEITTFINYWHTAEKEAINDPVIVERIDRAGKTLKNEISNNDELRNLCTTPLLGAMICALYLERKEHLPADRLDLYSMTLDSILEGRDNERDIPQIYEFDLTKREKEYLLMSIAQWFLLNGKVDASINDVKLHLESVASRFGDGDLTADQLLNFLLERSGVLRTPAVGSLDFIHKTFQEYLGAKAIVTDNNIGLLVLSAHVPEWREVVVLAAGLSNNPQLTELIDGILDRSEKSSDIESNILKIVAVACKGTVAIWPPGVADRLDTVFAELFPPRDIWAARSIAKAGPQALDYLSGYQDEEDAIAAACIHAIISIGGKKALETLEAYGSNSGALAATELLQGWDYFDQLQYAKLILKKNNARFGINWNDRNNLEGIQYLKNLHSFELSDSWKIRSINNLKNAKKLKHLVLKNCNSLDSISALKNLSELRHLTIENSPDIKSIKAIESLIHLKELYLDGCSRISNLLPISNLTQLQILHLNGLYNLTDLDFISKLKSLEQLDLTGCYGITDLIPLARLPNLTTVYLPELNYDQNLPSEFIERVEIL
tara:strand:- start:1198 stop:4083 length:2886 start_codon:yes stop_codon:yes gene_type:complete